MKNALLLPILLLTSSAFAQDPCDELNFISIQYSPFTDTVIVVHLENTGQEIFNYPGFVLIDSNGDTLAKEQVNLFGIGTESVHSLDVRPGVLDPLNNFVGDLELHTGFFGTLECEWPLNQSLCADSPCDSVILGFQNWGGALVAGDFEWVVQDESAVLVDSGSFTMTANNQYWFYGLCLEPGTYTYSLSALTSPSGGGPTLTVSSATSFASPTMSAPLDWFNNPGAMIEFPFFEFCSESPNAIEDQVAMPNSVLVRQDFENNLISCSVPMKSVLIYSTAGQLISEISPNSGSIAIPTLASGVYVASILTQKGGVTVKLVIE